MSKVIMMRTIYETDEFKEFTKSVDEKTKNKINYILTILRTHPVVHTKIAKKLVNTILYELRVQVGNEYRIITYTIDHEDINQAKNILLVSAFLKKSTKDYEKQIKKALKILEQWTDQE